MNILCACGKVEFSLPSRPTSICYCHCSICQKFSQKTSTGFAKYSISDLKADIDAFDQVSTSKIASRYFCTDCQQQILMYYHQSPNIWICTDTMKFDISGISTYDIHKSQS